MIFLLTLMTLLAVCTAYQYFVVCNRPSPINNNVIVHTTGLATYATDTTPKQICSRDDDVIFPIICGRGGPLTITVQNKTSQAIFINWNKSALICNDQSYSLAQAASAFVGSAVRTGAGTAARPCDAMVITSLDIR